ncbi:PEP-CTERM sorting domain-containing protein [Paraglaciecola sp. 25GB23A]|uniref:PEP-CTERM sorting domain-containing protein n=1 Tax=Paraglaciecola sp. 25GB23A TaxID=3156068 RepID=UPI0032AFCAC3
MKSFIKRLLILTPLLWPMGASAGVILSAESVANNTLGVFSSIPANSVDFLSDGSGLPAFVSGTTDFATYISGNPSHAGFDFSNAWASADNVVIGVIDFFLGSQYSIEQLAFWSQANAGQAINSFAIFTSVDSSFAAATAVGAFNGVQSSQAAQVFDLTDSIGSYVRLQVISNYGSGLTTTLGEIAFDVNSSSHVPTPGILALFSLGLAGLGWSRRGKA